MDVSKQNFEHRFQPQQPHAQQEVCYHSISIVPLKNDSQQEIPPSKDHLRKSSFLPQHLNVVPEFPGVQGTAADFVGLEDCFMGDADDWVIGIGIGLDMDTEE